MFLTQAYNLVLDCSCKWLIKATDAVDTDIHVDVILLYSLSDRGSDWYIDFQPGKKATTSKKSRRPFQN